MQQFILRTWQNKGIFFVVILTPLSWLFGLVTAFRRWCYRINLLSSKALAVPVIIVGNINVGGSGKTPLVIWLVEQLKQSGYKPGVISRGYGTDNVGIAEVGADSIAAEVGDEPLLIARRTGCPVWVSAKRVEAGLALLKAHPDCDVIISDDGLQHYHLKRNVEIAVVDEQTTIHQHLLPAGPLREPFSRLQSVDAIVCHGQKVMAHAYEMQLVGEQFYNLASPTKKAVVADFENKNIKAIAGIGKPERFFAHLKSLGLNFTGLSYADHYTYTAQDLESIDSDVLLMTEKDAMKCVAYAQPSHWVLPVAAKMDGAFLSLVLEKLRNKTASNNKL